MSDVVSEEVVVYGNPPESGQADNPEVVATIPLDMLTFYEPLGPTIIYPPAPGPGKGGDDTPDPKADFETAEDFSLIAAAFFTILGAAAAETVVVGVVLVAVAAVWGLAAHVFGELKSDPPNPDYKRLAGSKIRKRSPGLSGPADAGRAAQALLDLEHAARVFLDAIECAQGAFLAADTEWLARHNRSASDAYVRLGTTMQAAADAVAPLVKHAGAPSAQPGPVSTRVLQQLIAKVQPVLDLTPVEKTLTASLLTRGLKRRVKSTPADILAVCDRLRTLGALIASPTMVRVRFSFTRQA